MRSRSILYSCIALVGSAVCGCGDSSPSTQRTEPTPKVNAEDMKKLEGTWRLKSKMVASGASTYSAAPSDGEELTFRIIDGVMEMRSGDVWVKHSTLAPGTEPQCLLSSQPDVTGREVVLKLRYKLEGNTLTTVQDALFPIFCPNPSTFRWE